jgi:hypothetical protein
MDPKANGGAPPAHEPESYQVRPRNDETGYDCKTKAPQCASSLRAGVREEGQPRAGGIPGGSVRGDMAVQLIGFVVSQGDWR